MCSKKEKKRMKREYKNCQVPKEIPRKLEETLKRRLRSFLPFLVQLDISGQKGKSFSGSDISEEKGEGVNRLYFFCLDFSVTCLILSPSIK